MIVRAGKPLPFKIAVPDETLARVRQQVGAFPWDRLKDADGWSAGTSIDALRRLTTAWTTSFDWRATEARINRIPQFRVDLDGTDLHFLHVRGSARRPLLLIHGWPGSLVEFLEVIEPLAHPDRFGGNAADGFDVIVPSLPGYGFSDAASGPIGPRAIARLFHALMTDVLGYPRFVAQGGDWGSAISGWLAHDFPEACAGIHLNMVLVQAEGLVPETGAEHAYVARREETRARESAYAHLQSTKPQTLSFAMLDNPVGVAGWMLEKFAAWSDGSLVDGEPNPFSVFTEEQLLANISLYVLTDSFQTSTWIYKGRMDEGSATFPAGAYVTVPTGIAAFPDPVFRMAPRSMIERSYNVIHWSEMERGGHFAAFEAPDAFVADLRRFAATLPDFTPA